MNKTALHALGIIALIVVLYGHDNEFGYLNETSTRADAALAYERVSK